MATEPQIAVAVEEVGDESPGAADETQKQRAVPFDALATSHSSRIITLAKTNPFLPLSLCFVLGSVVLPLWLFQIFYFIFLFTLLGILWHCLSPRFFPMWFRRVGDFYSTQLQEKPIETIALSFIITLTMANRIWPDWWIAAYAQRTVINPGEPVPRLACFRYQEAASVLLAILSFSLYGYKPRWRRSIWDLFKRKPQHPKVEVREGPELPEPEQPVAHQEDLAEEAQHKQWEKKQQERWESWLNEEVERLEGRDKRNRT